MRIRTIHNMILWIPDKRPSSCDEMDRKTFAVVNNRVTARLLVIWETIGGWVIARANGPQPQ